MRIRRKIEHQPHASPMNEPQSPQHVVPTRRMRPAGAPPAESDPAPDVLQPDALQPEARPASRQRVDWHASAMPVIAELSTLRRYATAWLGEVAVADELIQASLDFALRGQTRLLETSRTRIWLLSILHRLRERDAERPEGRRPMALQRLGDDLLRGASGLELTELQALVRALSQLGEQDRAVFLLLELEGLGYRDVSDVLNCPIGTVVSRLAATRERSRVLIGGDDEVSLRPGRDGIHEAELHAYLDGELSGARFEAVETYLEATRSALARLWAYQRQGDLIRRLYLPLLNRPLPPDLLVPAAHAVAAPPRRSWMKALIAAGVLVLLCLGGAGGWLARDYLASSADAAAGLIGRAGAQPLDPGID
jgi:DNA-directed RNA polymerase specialized sigma24 family protein